MLARILERVRRKRKKLAQVARCQARGQLHIPAQDAADEPAELDEALAAFGLQQEPADGPDGARVASSKCYLWPCNVPAFNLWQRVQTQWRVGWRGREGLDYAGVSAYMRDILAIKPKDRAALFKGLQAMELAALEVYDQQKT